MQLFDFSAYKLSGITYGGSEKKIGILIDGFPYMLKFQKKTPFGFRFNTISEYLGSHIFKILGFDCQDTYLGVYGKENVVACKDFVNDSVQFVPFNDVGESTIEEDKEKFQYSYEDITELLKINKKITNVSETISSFFEVYIVDALLGNFDRHGNNWGFLKKENKYRLAPIFDNGSCLFPNLVNEDKMRLVIRDEKEIDKRVYDFPTSQIKLDGNKSSYYGVISSLKYDEINKALLKIYPLIDLDKIYSLIQDISIISDIHKEFYKIMVKNRYEKISKNSYDKLVDKKNENI